MAKEKITQLLQAALEKLRSERQWDFDLPAIQLDSTKDKQHGDLATNIAMVISKKARANPRELAQAIIAALPSSASISKVEIAGPGFINFFLTAEALHSVLADIMAAGDTYGRAQIGQDKRVLVEFVSSNPTGPLHVGHGRHAAYGAVVADLLETIGYRVHREYYVNDAGRQMDILAASVWVRYLELCGEVFSFPANGYQGDYVIDIATQLKQESGDDFKFQTAIISENLPHDEAKGGDKELYIDALIMRAKTLLGERKYRVLFDTALNAIINDIRNDLKEFGVEFNEWFSERALAESDVVDRMIATLQKNERVYEREGALWFRSTDFDDEKDRVLQRSNGQRTYFANDLAYHINKFERGFDFAIDIFGSDHHGYIPRMRAGLQAFGISPDKLTYLLMQFVSLYRKGQQVQMSTRSGSFVTLRELRNEVGNDAARFFYVMRRSEQPVDFDLDLAKSQSNENPVYYVQYAHARICSVLRQLTEKNMSYDQNDGLKHVARLTEPQELQLINTLSRYKDVIIKAAQNYEPHIITNYLRDLATDFHGYYNAQQFLVADTHLRNARLILITATRQVLQNGLKLVGVSSPESM